VWLWRRGQNGPSQKSSCRQRFFAREPFANGAAGLCEAVPLATQCLARRGARVLGEPGLSHGRMGACPLFSEYHAGVERWKLDGAPKGKDWPTAEHGPKVTEPPEDHLSATSTLPQIPAAQPWHLSHGVASRRAELPDSCQEQSDEARIAERRKPHRGGRRTPAICLQRGAHSEIVHNLGVT